MKITLAFICALLSCAAFADTLQLSQSGAVPTYAADLFGSTKVTIALDQTVVLAVPPGTGIDPNNVADVTFTLTNAQFGAMRSLSNLAFVGFGAVSMSHHTGGGVGESSVTYRVTVTEKLQGASRLVFTPGNLMGLIGLATPGNEVKLYATVAPYAATTNPWPSAVVTEPPTKDSSVKLASSGIGLIIPDSAVHPVHTVALDARTALIEAHGVDHDKDAATPDIQSLSLGALYATPQAVLDIDGSTDFGFTGSARGVWNVAVTGTFNSGDMLCVGLGEGRCDASLSILGGHAVGTIPLQEDSIYFYYVPSGDANLVPAEFVLTGTVDYALATNVVLYAPVIIVASLSFEGVDADGWSSAIPKSSSADMTFIRVTNETPEEVTLFGQGYGQDGEDLGFAEICTLTPHETRVIGSEELEGVFGKWSGRARVDFMSSGDISVQTMIRSGGILNNMTGSTGKHTVDKKIVP